MMTLLVLLALLCAVLAMSLHRALQRSQALLMALRAEQAIALELHDEPAPMWRTVSERPQGSQLRAVR